MQYWFSAQIRQYRLQFIRAFSGFSVKTGRGGPNNTEELIKVPCRYGDPTRVAASIVKGNSENKTLTVPFITCVINNIALDASRRQDPSLISTVQVNERYYDEQAQAYTNQPGNKYTVQRYMPVPYELTMQVDIWTNNEDIKEQLLEQILVLYNPTINLQTSNNPVDWTVLTYLELLENISWSSRSIPVGTDNPIDVATLQFKLPIWINPPAKVQRQTIIETIITNIVQGSKDPNAMEWNYYDFITRSITTPGDALIKVSQYDSTTYALSLCQQDGSALDPQQLPTVTFAKAVVEFFAGMAFIWNGISINITVTDINLAVDEIRSAIAGTALNCVIYNLTSLQFINEQGGDNVFSDLTPGSLAALGLSAARYPGGNLAWWRYLAQYGQLKTYAQYGSAASQIRLKTIDDLTQTSSDLVGWLQPSPVDQNIMLWVIDEQSLPSVTLTSINAIIDPNSSAPGINLPTAAVGQRYLLTSSMPYTSSAWGTISPENNYLSMTTTGTWTNNSTEIILASSNLQITTGQFVVSSAPGIPAGSVVNQINGNIITILNTNDPLHSNTTTENLTPATVNFYTNSSVNNIIYFDGNNWLTAFDSTANVGSTQYVNNLYTNKLYKWTGDYWTAVINTVYSPGYWTISL